MSLFYGIFDAILKLIGAFSVSWIWRKCKNTFCFRRIAARYNPDGLHAETRAIIEGAITDILGPMELSPAEHETWSNALRHPENWKQLIYWAHNSGTTPEPQIGEWSRECGLNPSQLLHVLRQLCDRIQTLKTSHFPTDSQNVMNALVRLGEESDRNAERFVGEVRSLAPLRPEVKARYPAPWVKEGARRPTEPFVGRLEELAQLRQALTNDSKVVCVLGPAGQGKSSVLAAWRNPMSEPESHTGPGLYWCRPYDQTYSFEACLDDLHLYLTGVGIDRKDLTDPAQRVSTVCDLLKKYPCVIVLDGLERWLVRWSVNPDASAVDASENDRKGAVAGLDTFLLDALNWPTGGALVFASRAVPHALWGRPRVAIGGATGARDATLPDFTPSDTRELFDQKIVRATDEEIEAITRAWKGHAYALHLLAHLLAEQYGGNGAHWQDVAPHRDADFDRLLSAIFAQHEEDRSLLETIACHLGPTPLALLVDLCGVAEPELRKRLAALNAWQLVEFDGERTDQHALIRSYLRDRLGTQPLCVRTRELALWWAKQSVPANPQLLEELRPRLNAIDHAMDARDADLVSSLLYGKATSESNYAPEDWLLQFGMLTECVSYNNQAIMLFEDLVKNEGRLGLRSELAFAYDNRGSAHARAGDITNALADHSRSIEIFLKLIQYEDRRELRDSLAMSYNNRGNALQISGDFAGAMFDHSRAIAIYDELVRFEGRHDLRSELAMSYNNRGITRAESRDLAGALIDYGEAVTIYEELVECDGRRELRNYLAGCYNNRGLALADSGVLEGALGDYGLAITIYEELVDHDGRRELRRDLAMGYNNRGLALTDLRDLLGALADFDRALAILEVLVNREGRLELRRDLAMTYNNQGLALADSGNTDGALADYGHAIALCGELFERDRQLETRRDLAGYHNNRGGALWNSGDVLGAIADYNRAITLREELVDLEGRHELRRDLALSYNNRGIGHARLGASTEANYDFQRGISLLRICLEEGQGQLLADYVKGVGTYIHYAPSIHATAEATRHANDTLAILSNTLSAAPPNESLLQLTYRLLSLLDEGLAWLPEAGLDMKLRDRVAELLTP
jgi:tetratricopeptide (TPR) repeat protein